MKISKEEMLKAADKFKSKNELEEDTSFLFVRESGKEGERIEMMGQMSFLFMTDVLFALFQCDPEKFMFCLETMFQTIAKETPAPSKNEVFARLLTNGKPRITH